MQQLIDLTVPLGPDTPLYPGDPPPEATLLSDIGSGDPVTASKLSLGAHIGTHVDLPAHADRIHRAGLGEGTLAAIGHGSQGQGRDA